MGDEGPVRYLEMLGAWSRAQRLVGWNNTTDRSKYGLVPSLAGAALLCSAEPWVDFGSGAGLPGLALAMLGRGSRGWLVEARRKRASFLREARRALPLRVPLEVVERRVHVAADLALPPETVLLARALAAPEEVLALARRLGTGTVVLWLGAAGASRLRAAEKATGFEVMGGVEGETWGGNGAVWRLVSRDATAG